MMVSASVTAVKVPYDYLFKILLIGDSGVGKTCLLFRFSDDAFNTTFIATIGIDFKIKTIDVDGKRVKLQIWDTAGHERFRTITTAYYRGAMGIILVYDITNEKSFENISNWIRNIEEHTNTISPHTKQQVGSSNTGVEKIICGNKCDIPPQLRKISKEKGQKLADEQNVAFLETSAKSGINVELAFYTLAKNIKDKADERMKLSKTQTQNSDMISKSSTSTNINLMQRKSKQNSFFFNMFRCVIL